MDLKKFGDFIKELRKEKGLNQEELAEELLVHRTTVVKWEQGKALPLNDTLVMLSKYFNVTVDELLSGSRKTEETSLEDKNEVTLSLLSSRRRSMLIAKYFAIIAFILGVLFLIYYFFTTYNSIHVYLMYGNGNNIATKDSLLIVSNDKVYLKIGSFHDEVYKTIDVTDVTLYVDNEYETKKLFSGDPKQLLVEKIENIEIFNIHSLKETYDDMYLLVRYDGKEEIIKLTVIKDFENKSLLQLIFKNTTENNVPNKFDIKLSDKFKYDEETDTYKLRDDNVEIECTEDIVCRIFIRFGTNSEKNYEYDNTIKQIMYKYNYNGYLKEKSLFLIGDMNVKEQKIYNDFKENILDKYLS